MFCSLLDMFNVGLAWIEINFNKWVTKINLKQQFSRIELSMILDRISTFLER